MQTNIRYTFHWISDGVPQTWVLDNLFSWTFDDRIVKSGLKTTEEFLIKFYVKYSIMEPTLVMIRRKMMLALILCNRFVLKLKLLKVLARGNKKRNSRVFQKLNVIGSVNSSVCKCIVFVQEFLKGNKIRK